MKTLFWNCQGLGNRQRVQALKIILQQQDPTLVFLSETKCQQGTLRLLKAQLGFDKVRGVNSKSQFGGLALFWKDEANIRILSSLDYHIDAEIGGVGDATHWKITGFYGHPIKQERDTSWNLLRQLAQRSSLPWVVGATFN